MDYQIGAYDSSARSVPVTFTHASATQASVTHSRSVNAVLDAEGAYDAEATAARVADVARGVAYKIEAGIITNPPPEGEPAAANGD